MSAFARVRNRRAARSNRNGSAFRGNGDEADDTVELPMSSPTPGQGSSVLPSWCWHVDLASRHVLGRRGEKAAVALCPLLEFRGQRPPGLRELLLVDVAARRTTPESGRATSAFMKSRLRRKWAL